jgi:hypothetical protein
MNKEAVSIILRRPLLFSQFLPVTGLWFPFLLDSPKNKPATDSCFYFSFSNRLAKSYSLFFTISCYFIKTLYFYNLLNSKQTNKPKSYFLTIIVTGNFKIQN